MNNQTQTQTRNNKIDRLEKSANLMMFVDSSNTIIGHIPFGIYLVFDLFINNDQTGTLRAISSIFGFTFLSFSYSIKPILFYLTNNLFRETLHDYIKCLFRIFKK